VFRHDSVHSFFFLQTASLFVDLFCVRHGVYFRRRFSSPYPVVSSAGHTTYLFFLFQLYLLVHFSFCFPPMLRFRLSIRFSFLSVIAHYRGSVVSAHHSRKSSRVSGEIYPPAFLFARCFPVFLSQRKNIPRFIKGLGVRLPPVLCRVTREFWDLCSLTSLGILALFNSPPSLPFYVRGDLFPESSLTCTFFSRLKLPLQEVGGASCCPIFFSSLVFNSPELYPDPPSLWFAFHVRLISFDK